MAESKAWSKKLREDVSFTNKEHGVFFMVLWFQNSMNHSAATLHVRLIVNVYFYLSI